MARAYRLGQDREVTVWILCLQDSVESMAYDLRLKLQQEASNGLSGETSKDCFGFK
jgi:SNF2 family DNA or RNA helicase